MKYIICGVGKIQNDFEYMFPDMKPTYYIKTEKSLCYSDHMEVYDFDRLENETEDFCVIICDKDKEICSHKLEQYGLVYGETYRYADDYFSMLDFPLQEKIGNRDIVIWGTGYSSDIAIKNLENYGIGGVKYYIDNDSAKIGTKKGELEIRSVDDCDLSDCFVIVASNFYGEIRWQLIDRERVENEDFVFYAKLNHRPSEMLRKTIYETPVKGNNCFFPFERANIQPLGVYACGWPSWLTTPMGFAEADNLFDIWNSNVAKVIRLSMLNHTYSFCDERLCPYLELTPVYEEDFVFNRNESYAVKTPEYPKVCGCSFDASCNLHCLSCGRQEDIYCHSENANRTLEEIANKIIESGWWKNVPNVAVAGNGEVFFSRHYKKLVLDSDIKRKYILIQTNGTLVKEAYLEEISRKYEYIEFYISIDAAHKDTFRKLRTGNWDALCRGLSLISRYRKEGKISRVRLTFVVQKDNYTEMIDFIRMAKGYGFDWVYFTRIQNFPGWEENYFYEEKSMINRDGSMKPELIEVFQDPLINDEIVDVRQFYRNLEFSGVGNLIKNKKETLFYGNEV